MRNKSNQRGVTLTELSISIAIISLMVAGSFGGLTLLKAANVRKLATEFTTNMAAINEFQTQYSYLPGDLPNASTYWAGAHDGTGDGFVDNTEDLFVWEQLGRAKLIPGSYSGVTSGTYVAGVNAPNSEPFTIGLYSFYVYQTPIYSTSGHALRLGSLNSGLPTAGAVIAKDAYSVDVKLDDGLPSSGMFYTRGDVTGCTNADYTITTPETYILSDTTNVTCQLFYWQKKF